jgi:hypothetical protein
MATLIWKPDTIGDWFTAANWAPEARPAVGDTVIVQSGSPTVSTSDQSVVGEQIILGGSSNGSTVTLQADSWRPSSPSSKPARSSTIYP